MDIGYPRRVASNPAVDAIRWGVVLLGLSLAVADSEPPITLAFGAALLAHAMWRTARPRSTEMSATVVAVVNETALTLVVVAATGWFASPFVITLIAPIAAAARA